MSQLTVDQALQLALQHQRANQLAEAEDIFRQILAAYPDQADALHLLGALYLQAKQPELAASRVREAIAVRDEPAFYLTLGVILQETQRLEEARTLYTQLLARRPDFVDAHLHLGVVLSILGRFEEAVKSFQEAVRLAPGNAQAQGNLGIALCHLGRYDEAIWVLRAAVARVPKSADFHASLAAALYGSHQNEAALAECKEAVLLNPSHGQAQNLLSLLLRALGRAKDALDPARQASALLPDILEVQVNYGECLRTNGRLDDAATHYEKCLKRGLESADLCNNLGNVRKDQGSLDDAIIQYRRALSSHATPAIYSNLIYTMQYQQDATPEGVQKELDGFEAMFGTPRKSMIKPHTNDRDPNRKLRIGYISTEFRQHALGLNIVPLLTRHDKSQFEIYCYADVDKPDFYTFRLRQCADKWHDIHNKNAHEIADLVRADGIDILLDIHQHMGSNRLLVYAHKPAPVQIGFAGYPGSSGLSAIDYRLTDPYLEPPEFPRYPSSETAMRLPNSFWCYHPVTEVPVGPLPAEGNRHVTFGNLNNFCKLNEKTYALWIDIMRATEGSRLLLLAPEGAHREKTKTFFADRGISADRIEFLPRASPTDYYQYYNRIDITLDSFPCNGHTTSMDSFFSGVPVTSYQGNMLWGRATYSQAMNLGLPELVGKTPEDFVSLSIALAHNLPHLAELRCTLRDRMRQSPLMDDAGFAKGIESAYRQAWRAWCKGSNVEIFLPSLAGPALE
jgi:protein O-GlcNAc transferase